MRLSGRSGGIGKKKRRARAHIEAGGCERCLIAGRKVVRNRERTGRSEAQETVAITYAASIRVECPVSCKNINVMVRVSSGSAPLCQMPPPFILLGVASKFKVCSNVDES